MRALRFISLFVIIGCVLFFLIRAHLAELDPLEFMTFHEKNPLTAILIFLLIYAFSVIVAVPSLPLNLAAGFIWGGFAGGIYSTLGATIGGWIAFSTSRYLFSNRLENKIYGQFSDSVIRNFEKNGLKYVALTRINPVIPTSAVNYLLGLTRISHFNFIWITFIFLLAPATGIAFIGSSMEVFTTDKVSSHETMKSIIVVSSSITFLILTHLFFGSYSKRANVK